MSDERVERFELRVRRFHMTESGVELVPSVILLAVRDKLTAESLLEVVDKSIETADKAVTENQVVLDTVGPARPMTAEEIADYQAREKEDE